MTQAFEFDDFEVWDEDANLVDVACPCEGCRSTHNEHAIWCLCGDCLKEMDAQHEEELEELLKLAAHDEFVERLHDTRMDVLCASQERFIRESPKHRSNRAKKRDDRDFFRSLPRPHTCGPKYTYAPPSKIGFAYVGHGLLMETDSLMKCERHSFRGRGSHNFGRKPKYKNHRSHVR